MSSDLLTITSNQIAKLQSEQISSYISVASSVALMYDYFDTLPDEIQYVWGAHWTPVNVLFVLTRYLPFLDTVGITLAYHFLPNLSSHTCSLLYATLCYMFDIGLTVADGALFQCAMKHYVNKQSSVILIFRTWAVWGKSKAISWTLAIMALLLWVVGSWAIHTHVNSVVFVDNYPSRFVGCHLDHASPIIFIGYLLLFLFETVIFALTLYKTIRSYRGHRSLLVQTLYRDGLLFYFFLFAFSLLNVIIWPTSCIGCSLLHLQESGHHVQQSFAGWPHRVMHAMLSARILLNIRKVTVGTVEQSDITTTDISNQLRALKEDSWNSSEP